VLSILLLDIELVKYTVIVSRHDDYLVGAFILTTKCFMDYLISLMNNIQFYPPLSLSHFLANYKPFTYTIFIFSPPFLRLNMVKINFVLDWIKVAELCVD
jgi:hypothetical protein